jgi:hypothetical protein
MDMRGISMKRLTARAVVPAMLAAVLAFSVHAQQAPNAKIREFPRWEWFWGFSYLNTSLGSQASLFAPTSPNYYGIRTTLKRNLHENIGLLLDAGGGFGRTRVASQLKPDTGQVLFGPQFTFRSRKFSAFAHPLVGVNTTTLPLVTSGSSVGDLVSRRHFALDFGGGMDINWKRSVAIRLFQADYIPTRSDGKWEKSFVVSTGVVLRFCSFFGPFFDQCGTK